MPDSGSVELVKVEKSFGPHRVLKSLSFRVEPGRVYSLIGESGCGKTTCLRLMNGLLRPDGGEVRLQGRSFDYSRAVEIRRQMGYSLQGYTLFPHLDVLENLSIIARRSGWSTQRIRDRASTLMEMVNLSEDELTKRPSQLSGGQKQRIGIARALFMEPEIMLMDEPFGALDPITRREVQDVFVELQKRLRLTVVLVTHDLSEAFKMSDKIVLMDKGQVAQIGRPNELLTAPANDYVARFLKSNSPGHLLRNVKLYTVMQTQFWLTHQQGSVFKVEDMEGSSKQSFDTREQLANFLEQTGQQIVIYVDAEKRLIKTESVINQSEVSDSYLTDRDDLLHGLQFLMNQKLASVPVINSQHHVVGTFGREALDVLS